MGRGVVLSESAMGCPYTVAVVGSESGGQDQGPQDAREVVMAGRHCDGTLLPRHCTLWQALEPA